MQQRGGSNLQKTNGLRTSALAGDSNLLHYLYIVSAIPATPTPHEVDSFLGDGGVCRGSRGVGWGWGEGGKRRCLCAKQKHEKKKKKKKKVIKNKKKRKKN